MAIFPDRQMMSDKERITAACPLTRAFTAPISERWFNTLEEPSKSLCKSLTGELGLESYYELAEEAIRDLKTRCTPWVSKDSRVACIGHLLVMMGYEMGSESDARVMLPSINARLRKLGILDPSVKSDEILRSGETYLKGVMAGARIKQKSEREQLKLFVDFINSIPEPE